ncbi:splicing factor 3a, subunit 1 [Gaertneriomyces sp. JEL0708]|nr:splicing factor 3a, subunit 1 [Gaertneriomyces sp. JEL0708]
MTTVSSEAAAFAQGVQTAQQNGTAAPISSSSGTEPPAGVIYPPPDIRNIVDKTANFVARNGGQFEDRIRENEKHNPKFCFLNPSDPYRPYYDWKVTQAKEGTITEQKPEATKPLSSAPTTSAPARKAPPAPASYQFTADLPHISAQDLDIIKLTAQFVARNGRDWMIHLSQREKRNYQFDFLRSSHSLFPYFTRLVEMYSKVLIPSAELRGSLDDLVHNRSKIMGRIQGRVDYQQFQEETKKKAEEEAEAERVAYASIDWHDFVIVDTVEFVEADEQMDLPPPLSRQHLENMSLAQKKAGAMFGEMPDAEPESAEAQGSDNSDDEEMDVDMEESDEEDQGPPQAPTTLLPANHTPMQVCAVCHTPIPLNQMQQHIEKELTDPKFGPLRREYDAKRGIKRGGDEMNGDGDKRVRHA